MSPRTWQDLETAFKAQKQEWLQAYPSLPFVERIIRRVFSYYDKTGNKPDSLDSWKRAIESFLRSDWEKEKKAAAAAPLISKKAEDANAGDSIRDELAALMARQDGKCRKCLNQGVVGMFRLPHMNYCTFLCDCKAADLADQLPENRHPLLRMKRFFEKDPKEWVKDF